MDGVSHADNVNDLGEIIDYLGSMNLDVKGLIGHSYGAKVLFDFIEKTGANIPSIFVATGDSILTPRLNNITLDLAYLKKTNPEKYKSVLEKMDRFDLNSLWAITEELATVFQENQDRHYFYWANLEVWEKCKGVQGKVQLPISSDVFESVRRDLYSSESNFLVDIASLSITSLWVNGVHDYIINGLGNIFSKRNEIVNFYKSSHYPHIEENDLFCVIVNDFFNNYMQRGEIK
jgi:proline iminopeptidase